MKPEEQLDTFVRPVEGQDDLYAFRYGFLLKPEGKASDEETQLVSEAENGDLIIEGWAADFEGVDRQGENFMDGAFVSGIKSFLSGNRSLCYHHKHDHVIGEVLDLQEKEGKGLWMRARVDNQPESSPLRWIYNGIKKGSMRGLSVGGFFKRKLTDLGWRIADTDFTEVSVTGVPVHPNTSFAVVAGKALQDIDPTEDVTEEVENEEAITGAISSLEGLFTKIGGNRVRDVPENSD